MVVDNPMVDVQIPRHSLQLALREFPAAQPADPPPPAGYSDASATAKFAATIPNGVGDTTSLVGGGHVDLQYKLIKHDPLLGDSESVIGRVATPSRYTLQFNIRGAMHSETLKLAPIAAPLAAATIDKDVSTAITNLRALFPAAAPAEVFSPDARRAITTLANTTYSPERYVWRLAALYCAARWVHANKQVMTCGTSDIPMFVEVSTVGQYSGIMAMARQHRNYVFLRAECWASELADILPLLALAAAPDMRLAVTGGLQLPQVAITLPELGHVDLHYVGPRIPNPQLGAIGHAEVWAAATFYCHQHNTLAMFREYVDIISVLWTAPQADVAPILLTNRLSLTLPRFDTCATALIPASVSALTANTPATDVVEPRASDLFFRGAVIAAACGVAVRTFVHNAGMRLADFFVRAETERNFILRHFQRSGSVVGAMINAQGVLKSLGWQIELGAVLLSLTPGFKVDTLTAWWRNHALAYQWEEVAPWTSRVPRCCALNGMMKPLRTSSIAVADVWYEPGSIIASTQSVEEALLGLTHAGNIEYGWRLVNRQAGTVSVTTFNAMTSYRQQPSDWQFQAAFAKDFMAASTVFKLKDGTTALAAHHGPRNYAAWKWYIERPNEEDATSSGLLPPGLGPWGGGGIMTAANPVANARATLPAPQGAGPTSSGAGSGPTATTSTIVGGILQHNATSPQPTSQAGPTTQQSAAQSTSAGAQSGGSTTQQPAAQSTAAGAQGGGSNSRPLNPTAVLWACDELLTRVPVDAQVRHILSDVRASVDAQKHGGPHSDAVFQGHMRAFHNAFGAVEPYELIRAAPRGTRLRVANAIVTLARWGHAFPHSNSAAGDWTAIVTRAEQCAAAMSHCTAIDPAELEEVCATGRVLGLPLTEGVIRELVESGVDLKAVRDLPVQFYNAESEAAVAAHTQDGSLTLADLAQLGIEAAKVDYLANLPEHTTIGKVARGLLYVTNASAQCTDAGSQALKSTGLWKPRILQSSSAASQEHGATGTSGATESTSAKSQEQEDTGATTPEESTVPDVVVVGGDEFHDAFDRELGHMSASDLLKAAAAMQGLAARQRVETSGAEVDAPAAYADVAAQNLQPDTQPFNAAGRRGSGPIASSLDSSQHSGVVRSRSAGSDVHGHSTNVVPKYRSVPLSKAAKQAQAKAAAIAATEAATQARHAAAKDDLSLGNVIYELTQRALEASKCPCPSKAATETGAGQGQADSSPSAEGWTIAKETASVRHKQPTPTSSQNRFDPIALTAPDSDAHIGDASGTVAEQAAAALATAEQPLDAAAAAKEPADFGKASADTATAPPMQHPGTVEADTPVMTRLDSSQQTSGAGSLQSGPSTQGADAGIDSAQGTPTMDFIA